MSIMLHPLDVLTIQISTLIMTNKILPICLYIYQVNIDWMISIKCPTVKEYIRTMIPQWN